jgi:molecular chaperone GrpE (heat shock protein)
MATDKEVVERKSRPRRKAPPRKQLAKPGPIAPAGKGRGKSKKTNPPPAKAAKAAPPAKGKKGSTPKGKDVKKAAKAKKPAPEKKTPKTAAELDAEMTNYLMKDEKTALKKLDEDMETYRANAAKKKEEEKAAPVGASA